MIMHLAFFGEAVDVHAIGGLMDIVPRSASGSLTDGTCQTLKSATSGGFEFGLI